MLKGVNYSLTLRSVRCCAFGRDRVLRNGAHRGRHQRAPKVEQAARRKSQDGQGRQKRPRGSGGGARGRRTGYPAKEPGWPGPRDGKHQTQGASSGGERVLEGTSPALAAFDLILIDQPLIHRPLTPISLGSSLSSNTRGFGTLRRVKIGHIGIALLQKPRWLASGWKLTGTKDADSGS